MRVFLTGGTGFIGGAVARRLRERGDDVVALVRTPAKATALSAAGVELVEGDLGDDDAITEALIGCDAAIHAAAVYEVGVKASARPAMYAANVEGTRRVLEAALAAGVSKAVYVSTVGIFGNTHGEIVDETYQHPRTSYTSYYEETKLNAHDIALELARRGLPLVIVQPGGVYGPGDPSTLGDNLRRVARGRMPLLPFPDLGMTMVHRDDVADGILAALDKGRPGESYVLAGEPRDDARPGRAGRGLVRSAWPVRDVADVGHPRVGAARWRARSGDGLPAELPRAGQHECGRDVLGARRQSQSRARLQPPAAGGRARGVGHHAAYGVTEPAAAHRDRRRTVVAVVIGVGVAVAALAPTVWHQLHVRPELRLVDLAVYRSAGQSLLMGRPVYHFLSGPPQLLPFTYPPVSAVFAVPLALVPWGVAQWLWTIGQLVLLAAVTYVAFRPLLARLGSAWPVGLGFLVAAMGWLFPIRDSIRFGQVDVALVALCLFDCVVRRPRWPRGLLIGVAAAVKLTPAVFVPYLWLTGRRRAALVAAGSAVGLTLAAALISPLDSRDYWAGALFDSSRLGSNANTSNQSLRGMLLRSPLPGGARTSVLVLCVAVVAVVGYRRARALSAAGDEVAAVAVVGLLAVLLSPVAWIHHLAWVVLVLGVLSDDARVGRRVAAAVGVGVFFGLPLPWYGAHLLKAHYPLVLGVPLRDAYGLAALVLVATLRPRRAGSAPAPAYAAKPDGTGQGATPVPRLQPDLS